MTLENDASDLRKAFELLERRQAFTFQKYTQKAMARLDKAASKGTSGKFLGYANETVDGQRVGVFANESGGTFKAIIYGANQIVAEKQMMLYKIKNSMYMAAIGKPSGEFNNCNCP